MQRFKLLVATMVAHIAFTLTSYSAPVDTSRTPRDRTTTTTVRVPKEGVERSHGQVDREEESDEGSGGVFEFIFSLFCSSADNNSASHPPIEIMPQRPSEAVSWSKWYVGAELGGGLSAGDFGKEYPGGFAYKGIAGIIFPSGFGVEGSVQQGYMKGTPKFDYATTTNFPNGDILLVKEIPTSAGLWVASAGVRARYSLLTRVVGEELVTGWTFGASLRYMWMTEEVETRQETYYNQTFQSATNRAVTGMFSRPAVGFDVSYTIAPASTWWLDFTLGYDYTSKSPLRQQPLALDWTEYNGQFNLGLSLKFRLNE